MAANNRYRGLALGAPAAKAKLMEEGVPVEPLQEAFRRSGLTACQLAVRMGWTRNYRKRGYLWNGGDHTRVLRSLGLYEYTSKGYRLRQQYMTPEKALKFCRALDVDPWEVGL